MTSQCAHRWFPGPESPDSMRMILGCADCGIPKPVRPVIVAGRLLCRDCRRALLGWRTDFAGKWHGYHFCAPKARAHELRAKELAL